jgi:hypothetical protein
LTTTTTTMMPTTLRLSLLLTLAYAAPVVAQPSSDIFLADLAVRDGVVRVGSPANVTSRPGYDNQPHFLPDGSGLLYTSIGPDGQADIFRYDIASRVASRVTSTPESEYSPTPLEGGGFAVVRVELDSVQRLWRFGASGEATLLLPDVEPVGYFAWADAHRVAMFVLGSPPKLKLVDTRSGEVRRLAEDIGRTVQKVPGRAAVSFIQRVEGGRAFVVEMDANTGRLRNIVEARRDGDFHAWTPDGILLMSEGTKLFQWHPAQRRWRELLDLSPRGLAITRIAVSPQGDRIALVGHAHEGG